MNNKGSTTTLIIIYKENNDKSVRGSSMTMGSVLSQDLDIVRSRQPSIDEECERYRLFVGANHIKSQQELVPIDVLKTVIEKMKNEDEQNEAQSANKRCISRVYMNDLNNIVFSSDSDDEDEPRVKKRRTRDAKI